MKLPLIMLFGICLVFEKIHTAGFTHFGAIARTFTPNHALIIYTRTITGRSSIPHTRTNAKKLSNVHLALNVCQAASDYAKAAKVLANACDTATKNLIENSNEQPHGVNACFNALSSAGHCTEAAKLAATDFINALNTAIDAAALQPKNFAKSPSEFTPTYKNK